MLRKLEQLFGSHDYNIWIGAWIAEQWGGAIPSSRLVLVGNKKTETVLTDSLETAHTLLRHVEKRRFQVHPVSIVMTTAQQGFVLGGIDNSLLPFDITLQTSSHHILTGGTLRDMIASNTVRECVRWQDLEPSIEVNDSVYSLQMEQLSQRIKQL